MAKKIKLPKYVLVDEFDNSHESRFLTTEDIIKIKRSKDSISKLLKHTAVSLQGEIGIGKWKSKEEVAYSLVDILVGLAEQVENIDAIFNEFVEKNK